MCVGLCMCKYMFDCVSVNIVQVLLDRGLSHTYQSIGWRKQYVSCQKLHISSPHPGFSYIRWVEHVLMSYIMCGIQIIQGIR